MNLFRVALSFVLTALFLSAPAMAQTVDVFTDRMAIPQGSTANVAVKATSTVTSSITVELSLSGPAMDKAMLSSDSVVLTADTPTMLFSVSVVPDAEGAGAPQNDSDTFHVDLTNPLSQIQFNPSRLTFTIPPNRLTVAPPDTSIALRSGNYTKAMMLTIEGGLQSGKTFVVFSEDSRVSVLTGTVMARQDPFSVLLSYKQGVLLQKRNAADFVISHLDALDPSARMTAQISAGGQFITGGVGNSRVCAIQTDNTVACWGLGDVAGGGRTDDQPQGARFLSVSVGGDHVCGVQVNNMAACWGPAANNPGTPGHLPSHLRATRFLSVSAGINHSCGIREDGTVRCWGATDTGIEDGERQSILHGAGENDKYIAVSAGGISVTAAYYSCGIRIDRTLACWGNNTNKQTTLTGIPKEQGGPIKPNDRFHSVGTGGWYACALRESGELVCWGSNVVPGYDSIIPSKGKFRFLSVGIAHACAIRADDTVACWGARETAANTPPKPDNRTSPTASPQGDVSQDRFLAVAAGYDNSCGIKFDGTAACWGAENSPVGRPVHPGKQNLPSSVGFEKALILPDTFWLFEQSTVLRAVAELPPLAAEVFTDGVVIPEGSTAMVLIKGPTDTANPIAVDLAVIPEGSAVLSADSIIVAANVPAKLSVSVAPDENAQTAAKQFTLTSNAAELKPPNLRFTIPPNDLMTVLGDFTAFVAKAAGGATEIATIRGRFTIEPDLKGAKTFIVSSADPRIAVQTGVLHVRQNSFSVALSLKEGAELSEVSPLSIKVSHLDEIGRKDDQISAGDSHTCGIKRDDGAVACWGVSMSRRTNPATSPQGNVSQDQFLAVSAGGSHTCGILVDNTVACWGLGSSNQTSPTSSGQNVQPDEQFRTVSAGGDHTCGVKRDDSTIACWGASANGQTDPTVSPQGDVSQDQFLTISAGGSHTCGIKNNNTVACWGASTDRQTNPAASPQGDVSRDRFLDVSAGGSHTCGIRVDNTVACWGLGSNNQTSPTSSGQNVEPDEQFRTISAGGSHTCGIKNNSTVACWGDSANGQTDPTVGPQEIGMNTKFLAVSAGKDHTCGILTDNTVACWGLDSSNQTSPTTSIQDVDEDTEFLSNWLFEKSEDHEVMMIEPRDALRLRVKVYLEGAL